MLWVKFCSMEVSWESHNFLLKSSGKAQLYFSTLRVSVGLLFTSMLTTKKQDPHHLPYIKHDHLEIDHDSGFQSSYRNTWQLPCTEKFNNPWKLLLSIAVSQKVPNTDRFPVFNFTSMRPTCLLLPSYYLSQHQNHNYLKKALVEKRQWSKKNTET